MTDKDESKLTCNDNAPYCGQVSQWRVRPTKQIYSGSQGFAEYMINLRSDYMNHVNTDDAAIGINDMKSVTSAFARQNRGAEIPIFDIGGSTGVRLASDARFEPNRPGKLSQRPQKCEFQLILNDAPDVVAFVKRVDLWAKAFIDSELVAKGVDIKMSQYTSILERTDGDITMKIKASPRIRIPMPHLCTTEQRKSYTNSQSWPSEFQTDYVDVFDVLNSNATVDQNDTDSYVYNTHGEAAFKRLMPLDVKCDDRIFITIYPKWIWASLMPTSNRFGINWIASTIYRLPRPQRKLRVPAAVKRIAKQMSEREVPASKRARTSSVVCDSSTAVSEAAT